MKIIEGAENLRIDDVMRLLRMTYWADKRSAETVKTSMEHSDCYGIYLEDEDKLVGFGRVITDYATSYYICDVIVDPDYRGRGYGRKLVEAIVDRPDLEGLRGMLITRDAHGLYRKFGFETLDGRFMVRSLGC